MAMTGRRRKVGAKRSRGDSGALSASERNAQLQEQRDALRRKLEDVERQLACGLSEENSLSLGVLPVEIWVRIATKLDTFSLFSFGQACKLFSEVERVVPCDQGRRKDMLLGLLAEVRDLYDDSYPLTEDFLRWLYDLTTKKCDISGLSNLTDEVKRHKVFFSLAARLGHLGFISGLHSQVRTSKTCQDASCSGDVKRCQKTHCGGIFMFWDQDTCNYAARGGHTDVIQWLRAQSPPCPWGPSTCGFAARGGHLETLKYLRKADAPLNPSMCLYAAARGGHLETLKWFGKIAPGIIWTEDICEASAYGGHLDVLKWLRSEIGCPWNSQTCASASEAGHLDVLRWLRANGCPWDEEMCKKVAGMKGRDDVVSWIAGDWPPKKEYCLRKPKRKKSPLGDWRMGL